MSVRERIAWSLLLSEEPAHKMDHNVVVIIILFIFTSIILTSQVEPLITKVSFCCFLSN